VTRYATPEALEKAEEVQPNDGDDDDDLSSIASDSEEEEGPDMDL
jgi:hypothetical protein